MKRAVWKLFFGCLVLAPVAALAADSSRPAMLTGVSGTVEVKGKTTSGWQHAKLMALLDVGDMLRTGKSSHAAVVYFGDGHVEKLGAEASATVTTGGLKLVGPGKRVVVPKGTQEPALGSKQLLVLQGGKRLRVSQVFMPGRPGTTASRDVEPLYLLSPAGPKVRTGTPRFEWTGLTQATVYQVQVRDAAGNVVWERRVTDTHLDYPEGSPPLKPRILYSCTVEAFSESEGQSSSLKKVTRDFGVLAPHSLRELEREEASLLRRVRGGAPDTTTLILVAQLYYRYGLTDEAIRQVERARELAPTEPHLCDVLGKLYLAAGRKNHGEREFSCAKQLEGSAQNDGPFR